MPDALIVDDNESNLYLLRILMSGYEYEVTPAQNGAEALEKARAHPPDLVISDILMPVMDGFTLCRLWRQDPQLKSIPFIFYSATYTDPKDKQFALSLGADSFLIKPAEPEFFIRSIREVVARHKARNIKAHAEAHASDAVYLKEYNEALIRKLEDKLEQLTAKDAFHQAILNAMTALVAVVDGQGKILLVNHAWDHYSREKGIPEFMRTGVGANLLEIEKRHPHAATHLTRQLTGGLRQVLERIVAEFEIEFSSQAHGAEQCYLMRMTQLGQPAGGAVLTCFNITGRKRMED